jgi:hypothetical protein
LHWDLPSAPAKQSFRQQALAKELAPPEQRVEAPVKIATAPSSDHQSTVDLLLRSHHRDGNLF